MEKEKNKIVEDTRVLFQRLCRHIKCKIVLSAVLTVLYMGSYIAAQQYAIYPPKLMPQFAIDAAIPFKPGLAWVYLSILFLNPIGPWLAESLDELWSYSFGIMVQVTIAYVSFVLFPTEHPRPALNCAGCLLQMFRSFLNPMNAMPALHASLAIYSAGWAAYMLNRMDWKRAAISCWIWGALILYATLAVKEHAAVDVFAGAVLGELALCSSLWTIKYSGRISRATTR